MFLRFKILRVYLSNLTYIKIRKYAILKIAKYDFNFIHSLWVTFKVHEIDKSINFFFTHMSMLINRI